MVQVLDESKDELLAIRFTDKVDRKDYDFLLPVVKEKIEQFNRIQLYWEMEDFDGWTLRAFAEEAAFDITHFNNFEKVAVVGDEKWEQTVTNLMKGVFVNTEIKFFRISQKKEAFDWIKNKQVLQPAS